MFFQGNHLAQWHDLLSMDSDEVLEFNENDAVKGSLIKTDYLLSEGVWDCLIKPLILLFAVK